MVCRYVAYMMFLLRCVVIFPTQQDLDPGDLVVTQDFKGAGLYTAIPDPDNKPLMKLKKNGRDSAGEQHDQRTVCV